MPLYILDNSYAASVEADLFTIIGADNSGFGDDNTVVGFDGRTYVQVTYAPSTSGPTVGADFVDYAVNSSPYLVHIIGVDNTVSVGGTPITQQGGVTTCPDTVGMRIATYYDVTQCGGTFYYVLDAGGSKIANPNSAILFHELSHVRHYGQGDDLCSASGVPLNPSGAENEAIADENAYRASIGLAQRSGQHGGCGLSSGGGGGSSCLVVTAAFGSPDAPQVNRLRTVRDALLRGSAFGEALFALIYAEYDQFSAVIARDMQRSAHLKGAISKLLVEPLLQFLNLLESYLVRFPTDPGTFRLQVSLRLQELAANILNADISRGQMYHVCASISALRKTLGRHGLRFEAGSRGDRNYDQIDAVFRYLTEVIGYSGHDRSYTIWALVRPLEILWRAIARLNTHLPQRAADKFVTQMDHWLSGIPIEAFERILPAVAEQDLRYLADKILTIAAIRQNIGKRLLRRYERGGGYDLEAILVRTGFLRG